MRVRDARLRPFTSVFLIAGVRQEVLDALPRTLSALLTSEDGMPLRRVPPPSARAGRIITVDTARAASDRALLELDSALDDGALMESVHAAGFDGVPIRLGRADDRLVLAVWHAVADGTAALAVLRVLLGAPIESAREARRPLTRALLTARPLPFGAALAFRRAAAVPPVVAAGGAHVRTSTSMVLTRANLETLRRSGTTGRATANTRAASAVVAALRVAQYDETDLRVSVPVDLRHRVPDGPVSGNFFFAAQLGGLRSRSWEPQALARDLAVVRGPIGPVLLALSVLSHLVRRGRTGAPEDRVQISMIESDPPLPATAFTAPDAIRLAVGTRGPLPDPVFVVLWSHARSVHLSIEETSGRIDVGRFAAAVRAAVEEHGTSARSPVDDGTRPGQSHAEPEQH